VHFCNHYEDYDTRRVAYSAVRLLLNWPRKITTQLTFREILPRKLLLLCILVAALCLRVRGLLILLWCFYSLLYLERVVLLQLFWPFCVYVGLLCAYVGLFCASAERCNPLQHTVHTVTHCTTLQHTAPHCNTLHHIATHCTTFVSCSYSLLHLECHFFILKSQSMIKFYWSLCHVPLKNKLIRLRLELEIESHSKCSRLYLY